MRRLDPHQPAPALTGGDHTLADYMSPQDLADMLGVPVASVYKWNSTGEGPPRVKVGRHVRYARTDVQAWLVDHEKDGPA